MTIPIPPELKIEQDFLDRRRTKDQIQGLADGFECLGLQPSALSERARLATDADKPAGTGYV